MGVLGLWAALLAATYLYFTNGVPDSFEVPARYSAPLVILVAVAVGRRRAGALAGRVGTWGGPALMVGCLAATTMRAVGVWRW